MYVYTDAEIVSEKLEQMREMLRDFGADAWFIMDMEGRDPCLSLLVGGATSGRSIYAFGADGSSRALTSWPDGGHARSLGVFDEVITTEGRGLDSVLLELYEKMKPGRFLLNFSETDSLCDGLSHGSFLWLQRVLGRQEMERAVSSQPVLTQLRAVKSGREMDRIQRAIDFNLQIYGEVRGQIASGMTERKIQKLFRAAIDRRVPGGVMPEEGPLVLLPKAGMSHRKPTDAALEPGDLLVCDFTLGYRGYHSDIARTFYHLRPGEDGAPDAYREAFQSIRGAIEAAFFGMRPGVPGSEVDGLARDYLIERGYPSVKHSVGHQIGQKVHDGGTGLRPLREGEEPASAGVLQEGEVYTLEPTILEGDLSMITEENVRVGANGGEKLNPWQLDLWYLG